MGAPRQSALVVLISGAALGCGGYQGELFDITVNLEGPAPVFTWDAGPMHELQVAHCEGVGCAEKIECRDGRTILGAELMDWEITPDSYLDPTRITSPLTYGLYADGTPSPYAEPLKAGATYAIALARWGTCDPPRDGCEAVVSAGCAVFTP